MSLYNILHGVNPVASELLGLVGLEVDQVPRFRDVYLDRRGVIVYTRTGGGNREDYESEHAALEASPNYLADWDDDYDCTYAYWLFAVPPEQSDALAERWGVDIHGVPSNKKWAKLFAALKAKRSSCAEDGAQ